MKWKILAGWFFFLFIVESCLLGTYISKYDTEHERFEKSLTKCASSTSRLSFQVDSLKQIITHRSYPSYPTYPIEHNNNGTISWRKLDSTINL